MRQTKMSRQKRCTGKAENALKQLEAETNSSIVKKRADVDEKQNALDIAEKELEEKNVSISDAVEQKNKAEQALEEQEAELSVLQRELAAQTEDAAAAQIEVDKKQAAYDEIKAMIMQLLHAQADYNQKQQEEVTAKTEYKSPKYSEYTGSSSGRCERHSGRSPVKGRKGKGIVL